MSNQVMRIAKFVGHWMLPPYTCNSKSLNIQYIYKVMCMRDLIVGLNARGLFHALLKKEEIRCHSEI